jgi:hypothetical protein
MYSDEQKQYMTEVLGVAPGLFLGRENPPATLTSLMVLTPALSPEELGLFTKIMASVQLSDFIHRQEAEGSARHILVFGGELSPGRHELGHSIWWRVPSLSEMLGSDPTVSAHKKFTWTLLQQLAKECSP